jgi:type III pantothenate kinase
VILCLDVGNTLMHGGVFEGESLRLQFRKTTPARASSDEMGVFLDGVLRANGLERRAIRAVAICSVVPDALHSLRNACVKYFGQQPFVLQAGVRTGLKIRYRNPREVGADRIANALAAAHLYPDRSIIVVDFGTATTLCVVSADRAYLGGIIVPGVRISMEVLDQRTAQLPAVEIVKPSAVVGRSTVESIQSGLYFAQVGAVRELIGRVRREAFPTEEVIVVATGGFAGLYEPEGLFDTVVSDLALRGLHLAWALNQERDETCA